jgi:AcrR family transcriptional regulator
VSTNEEDPLGDRLLEAAVSEFARRGYAGARVAEIARGAGVTTGAIYSRYRGKAELLAEAITWASQDEFDRLFTDHRFQGRMEDILRVAGRHLILRDADAPAPQEPSAPGLLVQAFAAARNEPDVRSMLRDRMVERQGRLVQIVDAAKAEGGIDADIDTQALVTFCYALGMGFLLLEVVDLDMPERTAWDRLLDRLLDATSGAGRPDAADAGSPSD